MMMFIVIKKGKTGLARTYSLLLANSRNESVITATRWVCTTTIVNRISIKEMLINAGSRKDEKQRGFHYPDERPQLSNLIYIAPRSSNSVPQKPFHLFIKSNLLFSCFLVKRLETSQLYQFFLIIFHPYFDHILAESL